MTRSSFPRELFESEGAADLIPPVDLSPSLAAVKDRAVEAYLRQILALNRGSIRNTAERAGITTRQLHKLMKKYDLRKEIYKDLPLPA